MAEITQTLGFDVSQALQALAQFDKGLASANQNLERFAKTAGTFNKTNRAIESNLKATNRATQRLTVSWGYLTSRILYTQFVVSYFGKFRRTLEEAASSAVDYQNKIAEITTISPGQSFDQISASVRRLSDQFNVPLLEEASAYYQTLSNGISDAAEATQFLAEANKFARATNSTTANSVNLLSAAVKSFGLSTDDTGKAAGVLFEAIRSGRITASELGPTFGRIGPRAAQLGISLEETAGALSAITVKGVKASEAMTQLSGIVTALSKPSERMAETLRKLGFSSAEAAVATLGLPGLLNALADSTDGTSQSMAKLFPNVRGIAGQLALTGKGLKEFAGDVEAMEKAGAKLATSKYLQATATDAERLTKELNKVKTALTVDLGQSVLKATADLSDFIGGADSVIDVAKSAGPALVGLGAGFIALRASIAASRAELTGLSRGLGALALLPVAYGLGTSVGQYVGDRMVKEAQYNLRQLEKSNEKALEQFKRQQSERRDIAAKSDEKRVESALEAVRQLNKAYLSEADAARRANDTIVDNAQNGLRQYLTARQRLVDELGRAVAEANNAIESSQERVTRLIERHEEREFGRSLLDLDDTTKAVRMLGRARNLASDAGRALSSALDKDQVAGALRLFERAFTAGEGAADIAQRIEDRTLEARAAGTLRDITDQQIRAEQQLQKLQADRAANLEKERLAQQKVVNSIREQVKIVLESSKLFDKEGKLLGPDELAKQAAVRQDALRKIADSALSQKNLSLAESLGLADFVSRFSSELSNDPVRLSFEVQSGIEQAQAKMQKAFDTFKLKVWVDTGVSLETLEKALDKELKTPDQVSRGLVELRKRAAELRGEFDKATASQQAAMKTAEATGKAAAESLDRIAERLKGKKGFAAYDEAQTALQGFRAALTDPGLNVGQLRELADAVQPLADRTGLLNWAGIYNVQNVNDFSAALEALIKKSKALETLSAPTPDATELRQLESVIQRLKVSDVGDAVKTGVDPAREVAGSLWSAARATEQIRANLGASAGPIAYKDAGGAARGTDTIPAMLSPGEFVVNARSARHFLPQLQAINAGIEPIYREAGGTVINNTVGDINISETKGPRNTAREVMSAIRREQRRGSGRL